MVVLRLGPSIAQVCPGTWVSVPGPGSHAALLCPQCWRPRGTWRCMRGSWCPPSSSWASSWWWGWWCTAATAGTSTRTSPTHPLPSLVASTPSTSRLRGPVSTGHTLGGRCSPGHPEGHGSQPDRPDQSRGPAPSGGFSRLCCADNWMSVDQRDALVDPEKREGVAQVVSPQSFLQRMALEPLAAGHLSGILQQKGPRQEQRAGAGQ